MSDRAEAIRLLMEGGWSRQEAKMITFGHEAAFRPIKALAAEDASNVHAVKERIAVMEAEHPTSRAVIVDATSPSGLEMMTHAEARYWAMINDPAPPTGDSEWLNTGGTLGKPPSRKPSKPKKYDPKDIKVMWGDMEITGHADVFVDGDMLEYRALDRTPMQWSSVVTLTQISPRMTLRRAAIRLQAARRKRTRGWK